MEREQYRRLRERSTGDEEGAAQEMEREQGTRVL